MGTAVELPPDLQTRSQTQPLLVVFLRHSGCPFCKQALADLQQQRTEIERLGTAIVLVHMMPNPSEAAAFFADYGLDDVPAISDPEQQLYRQFEVARGRAGQFLGPAVWWRGLVCTLKEGHLPGRPQGDLSQLAGVFLVRNGEVVREFRHGSSADRPDYVALANPAPDSSSGESPLVSRDEPG